MIVFVEGVDNTGKTELINELHRQSNFQKFRRSVRNVDSVHRTYFDGNTNIEVSFQAEAIPTSLFMFDFLSQIKAHILFDRSPFTEYAYGNPNDIFVQTLRKWSELHSKVIYCHRPDARLDPEDDEFAVATARTRYNFLISEGWFGIPHVKLDGRLPLEKRVERAFQFLGKGYNDGQNFPV